MAGEGHPITEEVYEAGKEWRLTPERIRPLGYYTLRLLTPPGSDNYAFEELVDIYAVDQIMDELYRVELTEFPVSQNPQNRETYFADNGFMVILNKNPHLPGKPDLLEVGYILNDR